MNHARPEYAIVVAIIGVLVAIGIPALARGQIVLGSLVIVAAAGIVVFVVVALLRGRG